MISRVFFTIAATFCLALPLHGAPVYEGSSEGMDYAVEEVASGFGVIWGMSFYSEDLLLLTERSGSVTLLHPATGEKRPVSGVPPVWSRGQGGLLDVAVQSIEDDLWVYFTYSKDLQGKGVTTLARAVLEGARLTRWQDLLVTDSATDTTRHFGSRITFDDSGFVYFSVGDRGVRPNGQDTMTHAGAILRLHRDGNVPADNPFSGGGGLAEIWSYGHRNPQGLHWDAATKRLWSNEHGPRGGDEINIIRKGMNYGWPVVSHGKEYWGPLAVGEATSKPGMEDPVKVYTPSIAPGSLIVYSGASFPEWRGNLFAGALAMTHLNRVVVTDEGRVVGEERLLEDLDERIRALALDRRGNIFFSTDSGRVMKIRPAE